MSEVSGYQPGEPCWADLSVPDPDAAARFYGELFGWAVAEAGDPNQTGGYRMFQLRGRPVAGLRPIEADGQPAMWSTYVATEDADSAVAEAREAGGQVVTAPVEVTGAGRMAVLRDPADALLSVWQPLGHDGAAIVNEPGAVCWYRLTTRRPDAVAGFYPAVFGWRAEEAEFHHRSYTKWQLGDNLVAVTWKPAEHFPAHVPNNWLVFFGVDDLDEATRRAEQSGAFVLEPRMGSPAGDMVVLADPQGASFALMETAQLIGQ